MNPLGEKYLRKASSETDRLLMLVCSVFLTNAPSSPRILAMVVIAEVIRLKTANWTIMPGEDWRNRPGPAAGRL